jgi:ribonucleoside-diphosphate reductase alpha chain
VQRRDGRNIIDLERLASDVYPTVRALDNVIDNAVYPLAEQANEAKSKRRMGGGVTGMANALEACGFEYGTGDYIEMQERVLAKIRDASYHASSLLAAEKGSFPLYEQNSYMDSKFIGTLPDYVRDSIAENGIRNSHLLSIAPTGTISIAADNISSGIEPVFSHEYDRTIQTSAGPIVERITDYGKRVFGVEGRTANDLSPEEHVDVLISAQKYVDSAVSKTCNVGDDVSWDRFKEIYMRAWKGGAKGCTTFRAAGKRMGILNEVTADEAEGAACYIDVDGTRSCE